MLTRPGAKESTAQAAQVLRVLVAFAILLVPVQSSVAQTTGPTEEATRALCFGGRPLPECKTFMLTEFGYSWRLNDSQRDADSGRWYLTAEVGAMVNRGGRSALGGALFFGAEDEGSRWGLRPRYRRWLSGTVTLDVAPGILFAGSDDTFQPRFPGFSGQVSLGVQDLVGLTTQLEIIPSDTRGTRVEWFVGVRGGSAIGIVGGLATLLIVSIVAATAF